MRLLTFTTLALSTAALTACTTHEVGQSQTMGMNEPRQREPQPSGPDAAATQSARMHKLADVQYAIAQGGPAQGKRDDKLEPYAIFEGPMPTTFAMTKDDTLFVAFPRWQRPTNFTIGKIHDGALEPFPDARTNLFDPENPQQHDPREHFVSAQAVVTDSQDRIWVVDTGSINMGPPIEGGPKLWAYDKSGQRVMAIDFTSAEDGGVIKRKTYLNDARFDLSAGEKGFAYLTDSGEGGIVVVDLATGDSWRKLDGHESVMAKTELEMRVEGKPFQRQGKTPAIHSDGIALSPDGETLYYTPLTGRDVYAVPTEALRDRETDATPLVRKIVSKPSGNDGIWCDQDGAIYTTDFEDNAIRRVTPDANGETMVELVLRDERLLWPDCVIVHKENLYVTSNQLHRQPGMQGGIREPFVIFSYPLPRE